MFVQGIIQFEDIFPDYQLGFGKVIIDQQCLITLIETSKKYLDNNESFWALLADLSKAFDCVNNELLIAKLHAYGLDSSSLRLIHSYLNNRQQRVRIDNEFSTLSDIKDGVLQRSILGPLFFQYTYMRLVLYNAKMAYSELRR